MNDLARAAFGDDPGRWPLPEATTPLQTWQRAVAAGGQGRYASGFADLDAVGRTPGAGSLASLALEHQGVVPTSARQARRCAVMGRPRPCTGGDRRRGACRRVDRTGRRRARHRPLRRIGPAAAAGPRSRSGDASQGRLPVRFGWVSAELAMFTGDGAAALGHAERAVELAASTGSVRHAVKSDVVLAAALCSAGDLRRLPACRRRRAGSSPQRLGLVPLSWALACLLARHRQCRAPTGSDRRAPRRSGRCGTP